MQRDIAKLAACLVACACLSALGCRQSTQWPEGQTASASAEVVEENRFPENYNEYLLIMDESERSLFFQLQSDEERDRFLQSDGILQKKYLHDHVKIGMSAEEVRGIEDLGSPLKTESEVGPSGMRTLWCYDMFNGFRTVCCVIEFENNRVTEWRVWLP